MLQVFIQPWVGTKLKLRVEPCPPCMWVSLATLWHMQNIQHKLADPGKNSKGGGSSILPRRDEDGFRGNQIKGKIQVLLQAWQTESSNIKRDRVAMIDFVDINCARAVNLKGSIRMRSKRRTSTEGYA
ncbi:hypothetical protein POTOM_006409 [Populus tomentosa]|uniref:Uncharacterized protein n=1 Tax=Populus tomentosa TaxID=118781 RepID=A0A8X8AKX2_POPTO|nr:hypothetical protein POTOM_006409 [Populus tomentosa]